MTLFTIPLRHICVKWLRTILLTAIFALGVAAMTALHGVSTEVGHSLEQKLLRFGANILVTPKRETLSISYGGYTLGDVTLEERFIPLAEAYKTIDAMPLRKNVAIIAPKLMFVARVNTMPLAVVGVSWQEEAALKGYWEIQGQIPQHERGLVAGATAAQKLGLTLGQEIVVQDTILTVCGLLQATGAEDDNVLFISLPLAQKLTGREGQAAFLEIAALCSGCPIEEIVSQLQEFLPGTEVKALRQVAESRMYTVHFAQNLAFYVSAVILVTACAMIIMSMLSAVAERKREIGILRSVGFSRSNVFAVFVTEALCIGFSAGLIGYGVGLMLGNHVLALLHLSEGAEGASLAFHGLDFALTVGAVGLVAGLAAAFPAWKATLIEPAEALVTL